MQTRELEWPRGVDELSFRGRSRRTPDAAVVQREHHRHGQQEHGRDQEEIASAAGTGICHWETWAIKAPCEN